MASKTIRTLCQRCERPLQDARVCAVCAGRFLTIGRLIRYLKPYPGSVAVLMLASVSMAAIDLVPPLITRHLVDDVLVVQDSNTLSPTERSDLFVWLVLALLFLHLGREGIQWGSRWIRAGLGPRVKADIRSRIYRHLEWLSLRDHDTRPTGDLIARLTDDTGTFEDFLMYFFSDVASNILKVFGAFGFLLWLNWQLALLLLIPLPLVILCAPAFSRRLHEAGIRHRKSHSMVTAHMHESLSGIRVTKAFGRESHMIGRFRQLLDDLITHALHERRFREISGQTFAWFIGLGSLIIWLFGGFEVLDGGLTLGVLVAFYGYISLFYGPVESFGHMHNRMIEASVNAQRVFEILDTPAEAYNDPESVPKPVIQGQIKFHRVTFGYEPDTPVLHDLDFEISPGEMVGLVGKSGAGKSTTINLMGRFYEVEEGRIEVDGIDIRDIRLEDLRRQVGIVLQEPILFDGTIADNIRYGRPDATFEEIIRAAIAANANDFILAKTDGYDTRVGERGVLLSGGEKQRISIARAILQDPSILILDEPTSSVDVETERLIQEALNRLIQGRTTIAIAHRLTTLRHADRLIVLDHGRIVETGTHQELMDRKGVFYRLVQLQKQVSEIMAVAG